MRNRLEGLSVLPNSVMKDKENLFVYLGVANIIDEEVRRGGLSMRVNKKGGRVTRDSEAQNEMVRDTIP